MASYFVAINDWSLYYVEHWVTLMSLKFFFDIPHYIERTYFELCKSITIKEFDYISISSFHINSDHILS